MSTKESEHVKPALEALRVGDYSFAINELRLASMDTPAVTSDDPDAIDSLREDIKIARARVQWLMMIAQRLDGRFVEADESLRLVGGYATNKTISELLPDDLREIFLERAHRNHDKETRRMLLR